MGKLFEELKRRKVFRVAAVYAVVAWVLIQVASTISPALALPEWTVSLVTVLFILGFPPTLIAAWAYEVTPDGIKADSGVSTVTVPPVNSTDRKLIYLILGLVLLVVGFQVADRFVLQQQVTTLITESPANGTSPNADALTRRFEINLGVTVPTSGSLINAEVVLSPDGKRLVFGLQRPGTLQQIYVQEMDQLQAQLISGADGGDHPFISPDGEWIAYNSDGSLRRISIQGGTSLPLADSARRGGSGFWNADNTIYYAANDLDSRQLMKVTASGGESEPLQIESQTAEFEHIWPWLLPDGDSMLITVSPPSNTRDGQIALLTLSTGDLKIVIQNGYNARYVPTGHIVFIRSGSLWAVPFDPQQSEILGPEVPVIQGVQTAGNGGSAAYTFSNDGLLIYLPGEDTTATGRGSRNLLWVDSDGNEAPLSLRRDFSRPVVSPDGQRLAVAVNENGNMDIWVYDLVRNNLSRLTFDGAADRTPLWTPDGERIVFRSDREGQGLWWRSADGTGQAEPLLYTSNTQTTPYTFTPDGSQLVYSDNSDLYLLTLGSESPPLQLTDTEFREWKPAISHDGRWIAYQSNETGRIEIYVRPFPEMETGKWQISNGGGEYPKWGPNDSELFFYHSSVPGSTTEGSVLVSRVNTELTFQNDVPEFLFSGNYGGVGNVGAFDISADGSQFLLLRGEGDLSLTEQTRLVAVENWFAELKRLAPPSAR